MKRFLAVILMLYLLCPAARAEETAALRQISGLASLGGDLYALSYDGVYRMRDAGWQRCAEAYNIRAMAAGEGGLYLLIGETGGDEAFDILLAARREDGSLAEAEPVCTVQWGLRGGDWPEMHGFAVQGDMACILVFDEAESEGRWFNNSLYRVSLTDGRADKLGQGLLSGLAVDGEGRMLTCDSERAQVVAVDPVSGTCADIASLPGSDCGGLACDEAGVAYYRRGSGLYDLSGTPYGYLPASSAMPETMAAVIHEGRYYVTAQSAEEGYLCCAVDPALLPSRMLRVCGPGYDVSEQINSFMKAHPDVAVELTGDAPQDAEAFLRHMQSEDAADIYVMALDCGYFDALRDKGYLADLSFSDALMGMMSRVYPQLTGDFLMDGHLYALPVYLYAYTTGYHPAALERIGLTGDELPTNEGELLDFIARWEEEFYDDYPEMSLYGTASDLFEALFNELLDAQLLLCEAKGETPTFNTPEMRAILARLEQLRPVIREVAPYVGEGIPVQMDAERQLLITSHIPLPTTFFNREEQPLLLALTEGEAPVISVNMTVMAANPYSENLDLAAELMAYIMENLPQELKTAMMPDENVPIEDFMYTATIDMYREHVASIAAQLADCDPADRAELEARMKDAQALLSAEEERRWAFGEEDIARYREHIAPFLRATATRLFNGETQTLRRRYLDGQMELEQFIREFDRMVTMKTQESN